MGNAKKVTNTVFILKTKADSLGCFQGKNNTLSHCFIAAKGGCF